MTAKAKEKAEACIPKRVVQAIHRVWPDGIVEIDYDLLEDSYFHELYPRLHHGLLTIKGASLRYERAERERHPWERDWDSYDSDWSDHLPIDDRTYSYHLFFVCPDDRLFHHEIETEEPDEEDSEMEEVVAGEAFVGCVVGVSFFARFAAVGLNSFEEYENGSYTCPGLDVYAFEEKGEQLTADQYFRSELGEEGMRRLYELRDQLVRVVRSHRITVLSDKDQQKVVPWLRAGEQVLKEEGPVTVKGAFFFEQL